MSRLGLAAPDSMPRSAGSRAQMSGLNYYGRAFFVLTKERCFYYHSPTSQVKGIVRTGWPRACDQSHPSRSSFVEFRRAGPAEASYLAATGIFRVLRPSVRCQMPAQSQGERKKQLEFGGGETQRRLVIRY